MVREPGHATGRPIRVLIADDEPVVRRGLGDTLEGVPGIAVVGRTDLGPGLAQQLWELRPDVVILDVNTLEPEGATLLGSIKAVSAQSAIVVFSQGRGQDAPSQARLYGAAGYVLKTAAVEELVEAIHVVAAGGEHF